LLEAVKQPVVLNPNQPLAELAKQRGQYLPDVIQHEPNTFSAAEINALESKGHKLKNIGREYGNMQAILWDKKTGTVTAASDPRAFGEAQTK
ncbi:MAG: gamma-glutamyltransferase, partial [Oleispira sp.]